MQLVDDGAVPGLHGGMQAVRRGLPVEEPASTVGQGVTEGEGVDATLVEVTPECEHGGVRCPPQGQAGCLHDGGLQLGSRLMGVRRQSQVAVGPEVVEHRPSGGDRSGGSGAGHRRGAVEAAQPVGGDEGLQPGQLAVAVDDHRDALGRVAVLVEVCGDRGHAGHAQVPGLGHVPELVQEREDVSAQAGVHVAEDPALAGHRGQVGDGVDHTLGVGRGGADQHDRGVVHRVGHGVDVGGEVRADRDPSRLDVEVVGGLLEGGVGAGGHHHVGAIGCRVAPGPSPGPSWSPAAGTRCPPRSGSHGRRPGDPRAAGRPRGGRR